MKLRKLKTRMYIWYAIRRLRGIPLFLVAKTAPPPVRRIGSAAEFIAQYGVPHSVPQNSLTHMFEQQPEIVRANREAVDEESLVVTWNAQQPQQDLGPEIEENPVNFVPAEVLVTEQDRSFVVQVHHDPKFVAEALALQERARAHQRSFIDPQARLDAEAEDRYIAMLDHRHERGGGR